jgi:hypothetical protein
MMLAREGRLDEAREQAAALQALLSDPSASEHNSHNPEAVRTYAAIRQSAAILEQHVGGCGDAEGVEDTGCEESAAASVNDDCGGGSEGHPAADAA